VDQFPSLKAKRLLAVLAQLGYTVTRPSGLHRQMDAEGRPRVTCAFHAAETIPSGMVRKILVDQVGLDVEDEEASLRGVPMEIIGVIYHREPDGWWAEADAGPDGPPLLRVSTRFARSSRRACASRSSATT